MFDSCSQARTSSKRQHKIRSTISDHLTIGKKTNCILLQLFRYSQRFKQEKLLQQFINIRRGTNYLCKSTRQEEERKYKGQKATQEVNDKYLLQQMIATNNSTKSESVIKVLSVGSEQSFLCLQKFIQFLLVAQPKLSSHHPKDSISRSMKAARAAEERETATTTARDIALTTETTTITTDMMSIGRRKAKQSLSSSPYLIPSSPVSLLNNIGQIRTRDKKRRIKTTAKMSTKRLMTTKSIVLLLVLTFMLHLFMQTGPGAQAIKLPSFLSWIQPASQSTQQQQNNPTQQQSLLFKHNSEAQNNAPSSFGVPLTHDDTMLLSASNPQEAKQQPASGLRKPFQSILLLAPSKHNHLFSALPKTLFGHLLSSSPTTTTLSPLTNQAKGKSNMPLTNIARPKPFSHQMWTGASRDLDQLGLQQLNQLRHQLQQQQQLINPPIGLPKKHALGLGENDEFMIVDPSANQMEAEPELTQNQLVQRPAFQHHLPQLHQLKLQQHQHQHQHQQQQQQQQPVREEYQEMPAIVISDNEQEQHPQHVPSNTSQIPEPDTSDSSNFAQISLEVHRNNSSEPQIGDTNRLMNTTQPTISESAVKGNGTKSEPAETDSEVSPSQQQSTLSNSTIPQNDLNKPNFGGDKNNNSINSNNVLTTLISDELSKLKQEPEVLNRTLASMSQPLVALFLDGSGGPNYENGSRNDFQKLGMFGDKYSSQSDQEYQQQQVKQPATTLENPPENGDLESSAAAIIVSPAGDSGSSIDSRAFSKQLAALSGEQIESFIIGPYKGLTSDSVQQQVSPTENQHLFRDLTASSQQLLANFQATQQQQQRQQQLRNQPQQVHFVRPQQSHVGLGMSSMASNLIQQAKSLIHLPFAHLANNQITTNHIPSMFRGQQQQLHPIVSMSPTRHLLNRPDAMIDQSSAPSTFHMPKGTLSAPSSSQKSLYNGPKQQPLGVQMMRQEQDNYRYHQQQQRRPFYKQQQVVWPPNPASTIGVSNGNPMFGQNSANSKSKPIHGIAPAQFGMQKSRYFVGPGTKQQLHTGNAQSVEEKQSKSSMPYFVENQTQQQNSVNRELAHLGAPNKFNFASGGGSSIDSNSFQQTTEPTRQQVGVKSHPLNDSAAQRQAVLQNDFHFVVNHGGQGDASQVGFQPTPSVFFERQQQSINGPEQKEQQQPASEVSHVQSKFKSGLYQIDPPRLAEGSGQEQQEHVAIPEGDSDSATEEDEQQQQQQHLSAEQQTDQQRHLLAGNEPQSSHDIEEDDSEHQQESDTKENDSPNAQDFARQVGATIGVGTNNKIKKGQVFNEPLAPGELASRRPNEHQRPRGKNITQMKKLKHIQDITLYDFEIPQRQKPEQHHQQQQQAGEQQKQVAQQVNYLDTQVYTIPYTLSMQSQAGNGAPVFSATPSVSESYQTSSFQQPALRQHQQRPLFNPYNQIGRFPLAYFPPPPPQALHEMDPPAQQQYMASTHQVRHSGSNMPPKAHEQANSVAAQSASRSLHQDMGGQGNHWRQNTVPSVVAQSQGLILQQNPSGEQLQLTNSFEPAQVSGNNRQHYFHYQPVASFKQIASQEQQHLPSLHGNSNGQLSNEQAVYDFPSTATQMPIEQQQYMLAIRHQGDQAAPNSASLFSSNFVTLPQQHQQQTSVNQASEANQFNEVSSSKMSQESSTETTPGQVLAAISEPSVRENEPSQQVSPFQSQNEQREQGISGETETREPEREQIQLISQSSSQVNSPSAFCADRAPGLYADESQRCKAYYQCAPTGHQMFKCNNQTQFNQKTQNCDWWYNVNCGGRFGSQADFEQAPITTTTMTTTQAGSTNNAESSPQSSEVPPSRQSDRDAVASSMVVNQESSSADNGAGQQVAPLSVLILTDDQSARGTEGQHQKQTLESQDRSQGQHSKWNQQQQQGQEEEPDMFHHSDSMANITVAPDVSDNRSDQQQQQQQQQQLAAPSSTQSYSELQASAVKEIEAFSQRSSTTQDPLLGANQEQSNTEGSNSQQQGQQSAADSQPQVGAILSGSEGALDVLSSTATSLPVASASGSQSESPSSSPNSSTSSVTVSSLTISAADATASNIQSNSVPSSSEPQQVTTTALSVTSPTSRGQSAEEQQNANDGQSANSKGRRLVQSEFGLGVKQGGAAKLARSTLRFQFTRNSAASDDNLLPGKLFTKGGGTRADEQYQHANHKYSSLGSDRDATQIYSTSANQGSVSYMPADEHNFMAAKAVQQQESGEQQGEGAVAGERRAEKRFGERIINAPGKPAKAITTPENKSADRQNGNKIQKR